MLRRIGILVLAGILAIALFPGAALGVYPGDGEGDGGGDYWECETVYPPKDLEGAAGDGFVALWWRNKGENYHGTLVLRSEVGFAATPTSSADQVAISDGLRSELIDDGLTNGVDYYYTLFNVDWEGRFSEPATITIFPGMPTSLWAWSGSEVALFGSTVTLWASLRRADPGTEEPGEPDIPAAPAVPERSGEAEGAVASPRTGQCEEWWEEESVVVPDREDVTVFKSMDHGKTWTEDGTAVWDPEEQMYRADRVIQANTKFQFRFAGDKTSDPVLAASESNWVWVPCKAGVKRPYNAKVVKKNKKFNVTGRMLHRSAGRVKLYFFHKDKKSGKWVKAETVYARNINSTRTLARYRLRSKGQWYVKGYYSDYNHTTTWTDKRYFYVR